MDSSRAQLKKRINELAGEIEETRQRIPAHSTKPPIMMELFDLEERYDELCSQLEKMDKDGRKSTSI